MELDLIVKISVMSDGSIEINHGGVEIGQGIDTKVAQTVAYVLDAPLNQITVKQNTTQATPNDSSTTGSKTSGLCSFAAFNASTELILD